MNSHRIPAYSRFFRYTFRRDGISVPELDNPFSWDGFGTTEYFAPNRRVPPPVVDGIPIIRRIDPLNARVCYYCGGDLKHEVKYQSQANYGEWRRGDGIQCEKCHWWTYVWSKSKSYPYDFVRNVFYESFVHEFDVHETDVPLTALRHQIAKRELDLRSLSPRNLELLVGSVFRDYMGCSVKHVGGPNDQGIDVLLSESETPIAVQVKRRLHAKPSESVRVVRDLIGSMILGGIPRGIVVSTAETFSKPAQDAAHSFMLERNKIELELIGYAALMDRIRDASVPERPWTNFGYMGPDLPEDSAGRVPHP